MITEVSPITTPLDLSEAFSHLFEQTTGTGEEELLRIASNYSLQLTGSQIKRLLLLLVIATFKDPGDKEFLRIESFIDKWLELKQHNNSDLFVMKALEFISLKKFLGENSIKVNVEK